MNRFLIRLYPEKGRTEPLDLEYTLPIVKGIARNYSLSGMRATNKKWIEDDSISVTGDVLQFVLASDAWLQFPTKAIRGFISQLSKTEEYKVLITPNGRLFKGESEEIIEQKETKDELSDEQTLIEVTKLFFRETEDNRKKINRIKEILGGK